MSTAPIDAEPLAIDAPAESPDVEGIHPINVNMYGLNAQDAADRLQLLLDLGLRAHKFIVEELNIQNQARKAKEDGLTKSSLYIPS